MRFLIVVQARTGSSRLPGKTLMKIKGESVLWRQIERIKAAVTPFHLVVATTTDPSDAPIRRLCNDYAIACFSGHPTDLLDRHFHAAQWFSNHFETPVDAVVKIPSDCPLIDPTVIDRVLQFYLQHHSEYDFVSNLHPATYPDGNDVEIIPSHLLKVAFTEAAKPYEREHTTPFFWEQPERFRLGNLTWETGLNYSMSHRFTLDYEEDFRFISAIYDALYLPERPIFSLSDILTFLENNPSVYDINASYAGVNWYRHHLHELKTVGANDTKLTSGHS